MVPREVSGCPVSWPNKRVEAVKDLNITCSEGTYPKWRLGGQRETENPREVDRARNRKIIIAPPASVDESARSSSAESSPGYTTERKITEFERIPRPRALASDNAPKLSELGHRGMSDFRTLSDFEVGDEPNRSVDSRGKCVIRSS